jgi:hypothetical protein
MLLALSSKLVGWHTITTALHAFCELCRCAVVFGGMDEIEKEEGAHGKGGVLA